MKIILYQPQIPQNTGNIVRTCSVTGTGLVLVHPLGFSVSDRWLKRAGLDYWEGVNVEQTDDLEKLLESTESPFYFFSSKADKLYTEVSYTANDLLIFGSETTGLPDHFHKKWPDRFIKIPMLEGSRCLNLATSVGIGLYNAYRDCSTIFFKSSLPFTPTTRDAS
jgi:tRNA (cytidine/uridine-2'-O-)-methyltransferase